MFTDEQQKTDSRQITPAFTVTTSTEPLIEQAEILREG